jgi:hypothetical protein
MSDNTDQAVELRIDGIELGHCLLLRLGLVPPVFSSTPRQAGSLTLRRRCTTLNALGETTYLEPTGLRNILDGILALSG